MAKKIDTRAVGLDVGLAFIRWLTGAENLHYGLWTGLDVTAGGRESRRLNGTIVVISATLRLSLEDGAGLTEEDKVTVTHRNGELLAPALAYGIDGQPQRGPTGYVLRLVEVR